MYELRQLLLHYNHPPVQDPETFSAFSRTTGPLKIVRKNHVKTKYVYYL